MIPPHKIRLLYDMAESSAISHQTAVLQDKRGRRKEEQQALEYIEERLDHNPFILTMRDQQVDFVVDMAEEQDISPQAFVGQIFDWALEKRQVEESMYTVVGTNIHHPDGFVRVTRANSAEEAEKEFEEDVGNVIAVFKGAHADQKDREVA